jgi:SAM-dependent methyltransferase
VIWVLILVIVLLVLDAGRMRGRLSALSALPPPPDAPDAGADTDGFRLVTAPGVIVDAATRRAATAFARGKGVGLLDLVPRDLPAIRAMSLAQVVDPASYRGNRLAVGRTALHAMLVATDVAERAGVPPGDPLGTRDEVAFVELAARLRHYTAGADLAIAPAERAAPQPLARRLAILRAVFGPTAGYALLVQPVFWALLGLGVWLEPLAGWIAVGAWHLQPALAIAGTPVRSRDLAIVTLLRAPVELAVLVATLFGGWRPPRRPDPVDAKRPEYAKLAGDTSGFWEPRRETCPICDSRDLAVHFRVGDLLQHKPGRFTLETCRACGHIFQNPRLSIAGLDFYYKDFYDGIGEEGMEFIFGFGQRAYHDRANMVTAHASAPPARWLDVGAGHGHFCGAVRTTLPSTRFDGLDLSASIDEAHRRGWIDGKYRGLFPELAPTIAGRYDAVSMSHYLEHTLDPRAELAAARTALAPGGHLLIEVPDPEFRLGRMLGRLWLPWFQPQHLHLLSVGNLEKLLVEHGFEVVEWHRGRAHQRVDFFFAVVLALGVLGPPVKLPWRRRSALATLRRTVVWTIGAPFIGLGALADWALGPLIRRAKVSNTYRVLARRGS